MRSNYIDGRELGTPAKPGPHPERDCPGMCGYSEFFCFVGLFASCPNIFIRIAAFVDVNGHSALIGGFCMVSLDMAPENGSTRQCSCFTLAEGYDASMEPAEVS